MKTASLCSLKILVTPRLRLALNPSNEIRKSIHVKKTFVFAALIAIILLPAHSAIAAAPTSDEKELERVLHKLDEAALNFRSTAADFEFDSYETDPVPDKDVQKGTVYYERKGGAFQMAAHIREVNNRPVPKVYVYSGGVIKLYEKLVNQVTTLNKLSQYESWFMLGFGASGKDLAAKWDIRYLGPEMLDGVKTEKLEMVAKDPAVRKNIRKVTVWMDTDKGVSLKQVFDQGATTYRVSVYFNIKMNQPLPADAFTFKTDPNPTYVSH
jgi:outer membrane lipoprotein-sorting protein